jgi:hypothetical protein
MKLTSIFVHLGLRNDEYLLDCMVFSWFKDIVHVHDSELIQRLLRTMFLSFHSFALAFLYNSSIGSK